VSHFSRVGMTNKHKAPLLELKQKARISSCSPINRRLCDCCISRTRRKTTGVRVRIWRIISCEERVSFIVQDCGIVQSLGVGIPGSDSPCTLPKEFWLDKMIYFKNKSAEAYFISRTNVPATYSIPKLERSLGLPEVSSN